MKWRLEEGNGEAIYEIGVEDNGILTGLNEADLQASLSTLEKMANRCILLILLIQYNAIRLYQQVSMLLHQKCYMVPNTLSHTFMPIAIANHKTSYMTTTTAKIGAFSFTLYF